MPRATIMYVGEKGERLSIDVVTNDDLDLCETVRMTIQETLSAKLKEQK